MLNYINIYVGHSKAVELQGMVMPNKLFYEDQHTACNYQVQYSHNILQSTSKIAYRQLNIHKLTIISPWMKL